jgi:serpin B
MVEMRMKSLRAALIACLVLPVCELAADLPNATASDQAMLVRDNNAFAVELYGQLRHQPGNLFFSPESISPALAMPNAGARAETAAEMAKTLHFTLPPRQLHPAVGALLRDRNAPHDGYQLSEADALWAQKGYALLPEFLTLSTNNYDAGLNQLDFKGASEASRLSINQWVEQKTANKIKDLIPPGGLDHITRLVLTNAIYFRGDWLTAFDKAQTKDEDFHVSPAQAIKTPLMHMTKSLNYFDGGLFQALEIPYKNKELSMIILLPKAIDGISAFEQTLDPSSLQQSLDQLRPARKVIVTMPKFKMEARCELEDTLAAMGMKEAFDKKIADFSGMASRQAMQRDGILYIGAVIHKADVDVDEEGTEAAAATAVAHMVTGSHSHPPPPIIFRADPPFMFLIRDNRSGSILFIARVTNPSTQQQASQNVPQPAEAAPPTVPPPPPLAGKPPPPQKISLGQTEDVVVADLGHPEVIAKVGAKEIYLYRDLKVTFVNGKVTDVAAVQVNTSPDNTVQPSVTVAPGGAPPTSAPATLDQRIADFKARQEKLLQGSETIVFSRDKAVADAVKAYRFLQGSLNGVETVRLAVSSGKGVGVDILFVNKQGQLVNEPGQPARDNLVAYVDDGTGYKEALRDSYTGTAVHVSRADGQVELFIDRTPTSYHAGGHDEFILQNNVFFYRPTPHARDCCGPAFRSHE